MNAVDAMDDYSDYGSDITNVGEEISEGTEIGMLVPGRVYIANVEMTAETVINAWIEAIIDSSITPPVLDYNRCSMVKDSDPIMCLWVAPNDASWAGHLFQTVGAHQWEEMAMKVGLEKSVYMGLFGATDMGTGSVAVSMIGDAKSGSSDNGIGNYILLLPILLELSPSVDIKEYSPLMTYYEDIDHPRRPGTFIKNDSFQTINDEIGIAEARLRSVIEPVECHTERKIKIRLYTKENKQMESPELKRKKDVPKAPFNFTKEWWANAKTVKRILQQDQN